MNVSTRELVLEALKTKLSNAEDNVARATRQFNAEVRAIGLHVMNQNYGESGETRSDILTNYVRIRDEARNALLDFQKSST